MKTTMAMVGFLLLAGLAAAADSPARTFTGEYQWKQGGSDSLEAKFEPSGDSAWDVAFRFRWNGSNYDWKGTASGTLTEGSAVTGTVESSDGRRTWVFEAAVEDGVLTGKHTETTGDRKYETGTFSLK